MDKTQRIHAQADSDMSAHGSSKDKKAENTQGNKKTQKKTFVPFEYKGADFFGSCTDVYSG